MLDRAKLEGAFSDAVIKLNTFLDDFTDGFPSSQSEGYVYKSMPNKGWVESFYTGMLWLAYEQNKDAQYLKYINNQLDSFKHRIDNRIATDTHDLGFLYSLSCVAAYKLTGNMEAKQSAIKAADCLLERWKTKGEFIQAWGSIHDKTMYRLIIDCMLNLPLLYWAAEVTGDEKYKEIATKHANTCKSVIIRPDGTTFHTYYFDPETGAPLKGVTGQGYSDDSCWARGQAWGIYGFTLSYVYTKDVAFIEDYKRMTDYFIERLPQDSIPYWDLCFTDGDQPRDTSAAAIAICGILEMSKYIDEPKYLTIADKMLESLIDKYTTKNMPKSNGLLTDGMYARPRGDNPECNIWGDYYYMEALTRKLNKDWKMYW